VLPPVVPVVVAEEPVVAEEGVPSLPLSAPGTCRVRLPKLLSTAVSEGSQSRPIVVSSRCAMMANDGVLTQIKLKKER
jgi:hypothetical protein